MDLGLNAIWWEKNVQGLEFTGQVQGQILNNLLPTIKQYKGVFTDPVGLPPSREYIHGRRV